MAIQFVYFDLGNVILKFSHQRACDQMAAVAKISSTKARQVVFDSGLNDRYEHGQITTAEFHAEFNRQTGTATAFADLIHAWNDIFDLESRMIPIVTRLRTAGHRLGILSNTCDSHWKYVTQKYKVLTTFFEHAVTSYQAQAMKPEAKIYEYATAVANVARDEIFFVDDRQENVDGALRFGWQAERFTGALQLADDLQRRSLEFNR